MQLFRFTSGQYTISLADSLPPMYYSYCQSAQLVDTFEIEGLHQSLCYLSVTRGHGWPFLIVAQRYSPGPSSGFYPGALFVPETSLLLLGAGERLLAYALDEPARLWECALPGGFWQWERSQESIIMSSENRLATWDIYGQKRWDFSVEPPWQYALDGDTVYVYMGEKQTALHCERGIVVESTAIKS
ncbi:MAG TPA: hypothetical protein VFV38_04130 [Ktedonobacteraceae bacterium]|nr:hypothetical protein [Ktedonobacteraceae bacterium]